MQRVCAINACLIRQFSDSMSQLKSMYISVQKFGVGKIFKIYFFKELHFQSSSVTLSFRNHFNMIIRNVS